MFISAIWRFLFRFVLIFKLFDHPSEVHLNLVPLDISSPEWYDTLDSKMKFPLKAQWGFLRRNHRPISRLTPWVRLRAWLWDWLSVWIRVRIFPWRNFLGQHRRFLRGFTGRVNLCKRIRLYRILIRWRSTTMLSERHTRIFWSECSHRLILLRHMPSFGPVAKHLLREKVIIFDTTMERTFPWYYSWVSSPGEDFNMLFSICDVSVKSASAFEDRHYFCKIGEGKSHCLVTNEFRKKDSEKDRFSPISEKTNSFAEITCHPLRL